MFTQTLPAGITYLTSTKQDGNFSFKHGSEAQVIQHRSQFLEKHQQTLRSCVVMKTLNHDLIQTVGSAEKGRGAYSLADVVEADALVTTEPGLLLFLLTADCLPLTVYDAVHQVIGLAHLSRESSKKHLARKVVQKLIDDYGSQPEQLYAIFGPAIQKVSYILEKELTTLGDEWSPFITTVSATQVSVDLDGFNLEQLTQAGLTQDHIMLSPFDTYSDSSYFSHYRAVRSGEEEGRFATTVGLNFNC
jgi:polyphenol oxidase